MEAGMSFWKELSRRNVVKVGIAYAVAAWLIIHPVDIIFPILHLPEWTITLVAALLIIAFPFVLLFSWIYEITPKGLKKTKDVPLSKSIAQIEVLMSLWKELKRRNVFKVETAFLSVTHRSKGEEECISKA
jgi:hypothetical protein